MQTRCTQCGRSTLSSALFVVASHRCMTAARHLLLLLAGTGAFVAPGSFAARRPMKKTVSAGGVAPPPSAKEKLLWSPGVLKQTAASFAVLWLAKQWALSDPRALWYVDGAREAVQGALLRGAHGVEWWAALSLLSSSCCALQLLLNAFSLGCAGFNTYLGPLRPFFLALTAHARLLAADAAAGVARLSGPPSGVAAARYRAAAIFAYGLTFLPEILALVSRARRGETREAPGATVYDVALPTMGCQACVSTVEEKLRGLAGVAGVDVALRGEKGGTARVAVDSPNPETAAAILAACADAGFPPSGEVMVVA